MSKASPARVLVAAAPAVLFASLVLVPFLGKPFTIDDTVFLFTARHALVDPLHPTAFEMNWESVPERVSRFVPTGPLMAWLLVPAMLAGGSEVVAHLTLLAFLWVAILATVSLAFRLGLGGKWAAASGLILASTPAVLGMAGTAMPDVPAMALGVAGIERLLAWRDERKVRDGILAALLLGAASLARTHQVALLGIGTLFLAGDVFSFDSWKRGPWARWVPLVTAPFVTLAVVLVTRDPAPDGGAILGAAARYSDVSRVASNSVAFAIHWAVAMAFAVPWIALRWRQIVARPLALLAGTLTAAILLRAAHGVEAPYLFAPIAGLGIACLADVLTDALRRRDSTQFILGAWLFIAFPAVVYWHLPSKYLLASAPAAAILVARAMEFRPRVGLPSLVATIILGASLGVAILRADAAFAEVGRGAARALIAPHVAAGRRVWYVGHWGFQWYAELNGAKRWSAAPPHPVEGDLIAYADNLATPLDRRELEVLTHLARFEDRSPGGRVMSRSAGAGFYSNSWGYLPWSWGNEPVDAVDLWLAEISRPKGPQ
jgi:4-amino-4-deoxy-L-arabinose transferase-like glycosyltransferase